MKPWVVAAVAGACLALLAPPRAACAGTPRSCRVGAYLISLHDLDPARRTFGADLWLWSTCPSKDLRPLDVMDFVNGNPVRTSLAATSERAGVYWSYVKVSGVFRHDWNLRSYPFDRQMLKIVIENTDAAASAFTYEVDRAGSRPARDIRLDGWRLEDFAVSEAPHRYDTIFGDPAMNGSAVSDYDRLTLSVTIVRTRRLSFLKLVMGVYVAVALSILTFLLGPYNGRRRANILVGALFAVIVSQRVTESMIGRTEQLTLVDAIHFTAMLYIFAITLAGIRAQDLFDGDHKDEAARSDRRGLWIASLSFVAVNAVLLWVAAHA